MLQPRVSRQHFCVCDPPGVRLWGCLLLCPNETLEGPPSSWHLYTHSPLDWCLPQTGTRAELLPGEQAPGRRHSFPGRKFLTFFCVRWKYHLS